ncbi:hypothetical protein [Maioricimonas sp. JC845]|uniref:DUF7768 domain-containing protein n=1 Tax=Maioricimonas sp. JC845 TaxID=3232138 RepID=UPI003458948C
MDDSRPAMIYVAGPYTRPDPVENTHRMIRIADALFELGVVPVVPHLTLFWHLLCPRPYRQWLLYDLEVMARCDAVLRVPGDSQGADGEVRAANRRGQPVIQPASHAIEVCVQAVREWMVERSGPVEVGR